MQLKQFRKHFFNQSDFANLGRNLVRPLPCQLAQQHVLATTSAGALPSCVLQLLQPFSAVTVITPPMTVYVPDSTFPSASFTRNCFSSITLPR